MTGHAVPELELSGEISLSRRIVNPAEVRHPNLLPSGWP
jgi:hypothetical protein